MATTVSNFTAIDDTAVDAESPITESLMKQLRDNAYWINAGTTKTSESTANKYLETDGSGGVQWVATSGLGVNGTKSSGSVSNSSGSPVQVSEISNRFLVVRIFGQSGGTINDRVDYQIIIDQSDLTYESITHIFDLSSINDSGTLTSSFALTSTNYAIYFRATGGNIEFYENASGSQFYLYYWL